MGITIHYRGSLADLDRLEDFEDRVIDAAIAVGGDFRLWRSADEQHQSRMVRGLILDLAPGQESTSLLISPEGWLIGLADIEPAERGALSEKPWCFVKTQFGPIEGHVALVELLAGLNTEFMPDLEVSDESGYWEHRDLARLRHSFAQLQRAIDSLSEALRQDQLSPEAAEDPQILATRIERIARKVHQTMSRPAEHPPVNFPDDELGLPFDPLETETRWDALDRENRRRQARTERSIEERMLRGQDAGDALRDTLDEISLPESEMLDAEPEGALLDDDEDEAQDRVDLGEAPPYSDEETDFDHPRHRHPLQQQATRLWLRFQDVSNRVSRPSGNFDLLLRSAGELCGGLAQALPLPPTYELDEIEAGLSMVQLKRALRGAAFAVGALHLLRADKTIDQPEHRQFADTLGVIQTQIVDLLRTIRNAGA